ncbi:replication-relaxation family protein [Metaplanococcus flavidus]|uniref:Replication-relaxation family protein n=1 Tax=Metaplanococcus flavidus TaxID=569883 RepID=A0ABW3LG82_9BACL
MKDKIIVKGKGRSRIEITAREVWMLLYLENHHLMSTEQLFKYYTKFLMSSTHPYAFKNRLRKFEEYKIVRSANFADGFHGDRFKYYTIGAAGVDLLMQKKKLAEDYNKNQIYHRLNKKNVLHFLFTQQVVLNVFTELRKRLSMPANKDKGLSLKTMSLSPAKFPYEIWIPKVSGSISRNNSGASHARAAASMKNSNYERTSGHYATLIKPDWILERSFPESTVKTKVLNIELDTGTEQWPQIEEKIWKYCTVAENNKDSVHALGFVLPDETFSMRTKYGDRSKRIENMMINLRKDTKLLERIKEVNLLLGIYSLKDIGKVAGKYLQPELFKEDSQ